MTDIHSQPANDAYRQNWDRIFKTKTKTTVYDALEFMGFPVVIDESLSPNEIHLRYPDGRVDKIVNIGAPSNA